MSGRLGETRQEINSWDSIYVKPDNNTIIHLILLYMYRMYSTLYRAHN